ncbi:serine hydrolase [Arenibacterium sp. LLYu02]|uniref:serine hydrolase n=1 Tax=Arenibacterium sp. LLYu02 TaxID=3404132 RepID=UPI003B226D32
MPNFSPAALLANPQDIADYFTTSADAPGAIISVSDGTRRVSVASGLSDMAANLALDATQSFKIGSQTKMMTAMVVLELAEEGMIDLDAPFAAYLSPDLINGIANADSATVRQALQMRTGIQNYTSAERPDGTSQFDMIAQNPDGVFGADQILELLEGLPATAEVGQAYEYSNTNYFYLSKVIEAVTGQDLGQVFQERIFAPLGMTNSYLNDFRDNPNLVSNYLLLDGALVDTTDLLVDAQGEGGVVSTVEDMTKFLTSLLVDQTLTSETVLSTMTHFATGDQDPRGFTFNYGLSAFDYGELGTFVGFAGGIFGTDSATYLNLESGRIFSTMVNLGNGDASGTGIIISTEITLAEDQAWQQDPQGTPLLVEGVSAADVEIATQDGLSSLGHDGARFLLSQHIKAYETDDFVFEDGSRLYLGSRQDDVLSAQRSGARGDQMLGFAGDDILTGATGGDLLNGGIGDDRLLGKAGADRLLGGAGADVLKGQEGRDLLLGGAGQDQLLGGGGGDRLIGGRGSDFLTGGGGADRFIFKRGALDGQLEHDVIVDYEIGVDVIDLIGRRIVGYAVDDTGTTVVLNGEVDTILVHGVFDPTDITFL